MNDIRQVTTDKAPAAIGPYSQALIFERIIFTSGQLPIDPQTGLITGKTAAEQTEQALINLGAVLQAAGSQYSCVLKTT